MANNLRSLRKARGWTQDQAATALGTKLTQYAKLELGIRRLSDVWIDKAAAAFGVDTAEVVRGPEPEVMGRVSQNGVVVWEAGEPASEQQHGLRVETDALGILLRDSLLVFHHERRDVERADHDRVMLVAVGDQVVVRRLAFTSGRKTAVHAIAAGGMPLLDVVPDWVSPVLSFRTAR